MQDISGGEEQAQKLISLQAEWANTTNNSEAAWWDQDSEKWTRERERRPSLSALVFTSDVWASSNHVPVTCTLLPKSMARLLRLWETTPGLRGTMSSRHSHVIQQCWPSLGIWYCRIVELSNDLDKSLKDALRQCAHQLKRLGEVSTCKEIQAYRKVLCIKKGVCCS